MSTGFGRRLALAVGIACLCSPGAAIASPEDVFVSDESAFGGFGAILRLGPGGGAADPIATGPPFDEPSGIEWTGPHTIAVADDDAAVVFSVDTLTGARSTIASGPPLSSPTGIDIAPDGAIYVSDTGTPDAIYRIDPSTHAVTTLVSGAALESPRELAVTRQGFAYLAEQSLGIVKVDLSSGTVSTVATGAPLLNGSNRIALSPDEKTLWISNRVLAAATVTKLDLTTGVPTKLVDIEGSPGGIALQTKGSLLVTDTTNDTILRIGASGTPIDTFSNDPDFVASFDLIVEPALCGKRFPTVVGTDAPEVLTGTPFKDVIDGRGGADQISGLGAKDVLCGGAGNDRITGGPGNDQLLGQGGRDKLIASKGRRDSCNGGKGRDRVRGCEKTRKIP